MLTLLALSVCHLTHNSTLPSTCTYTTHPPIKSIEVIISSPGWQQNRREWARHGVSLRTNHTINTAIEARWGPWKMQRTTVETSQKGQRERYVPSGSIPSVKEQQSNLKYYLTGSHCCTATHTATPTNISEKDNTRRTKNERSKHHENISECQRTAVFKSPLRNPQSTWQTRDWPMDK